VTRQLPIAPFTLRECEEFATYKHLDFDRRQLAECYMALGGVAYYWSLLQEGLSAAQNFDRLFFGVADKIFRGLSPKTSRGQVPAERADRGRGEICRVGVGRGAEKQNEWYNMWASPKGEHRMKERTITHDAA
jgi:hypothetical protein